MLSFLLCLRHLVYRGRVLIKSCIPVTDIEVDGSLLHWLECEHLVILLLTLSFNLCNLPNFLDKGKFTISMGDRANALHCRHTSDKVEELDEEKRHQAKSKRYP